MLAKWRVLVVVAATCGLQAGMARAQEIIQVINADVAPNQEVMQVVPAGIPRNHEVMQVVPAGIPRNHEVMQVIPGGSHVAQPQIYQVIRVPVQAVSPDGIVQMMSTQPAPASQEILPPARIMPTPTGPVVDAQNGHAPAGFAAYPGAGGAGGERLPRVRALLHDHGYCCGVDIDSVGCMNIHESLRFIFGSCRSFFGEPCLPRQQGMFNRSGGQNDGRNGFGASGGCRSCGH